MREMQGELVRSEEQELVRVGRKTYLLDEVIGQTDSSKVYKAHLEGDSERSLALKVVFLNAQAGLEELGTFASIDERVKVYQNIDHPLIAKLEDFFYIKSVGEMPVVVREYIPGESMQEQIGEGRMCSPEEAMGIFRSLLEISEYLETSSTREIVVRDIKPGNIIVNGDGKAHLTDLELCTSSGQATTGGRGTITYMCPEQLVGGEPTSMWDRYSIAKTMEHLLTGKEPEHGTPVNLPYGINVSTSIREILHRMTAREPLERFGSSNQIQKELDSCRNDIVEEKALVPQGSTALVDPNGQPAKGETLCLPPQEVQVILRYADRTDFEGKDDEERELIKRFCSYANSLDPEDARAPLVYDMVRAIRICLEARNGFTKKKNFGAIISSMIEKVNYDVVRESEKDEYCLVDPYREKARVIHIHGPNAIYLSELRDGTRIDDFVSNFGCYYANGKDPVLEKKWDRELFEVKDGCGALAALASVAGVVTSIIGGCVTSDPMWIAYGLAGGASFAGICGIVYGVKSTSIEEEREKKRKEVQVPWESHSRNLPSTLIRAFLPEFEGGNENE